MNKNIKRGSRVYCAEGPSKGREGTVTMVRREFDRDTETTRWIVHFDCGRFKIKTRLAWVREISVTADMETV